MRKLLMIQSISDIITNSSSEVFLIHSSKNTFREDYTIESLRDLQEHELNFYMEAFPELPPYDRFKFCSGANATFEHYEWEDYVRDNAEALEQLIGYSFVEICDNDYSDWDRFEIDCDNARKISIHSEIRR